MELSKLLLPAGVKLNLLVFKRVMQQEINPKWTPIAVKIKVPCYSNDISCAMEVLEDKSLFSTSWRFSSRGGDSYRLCKTFHGDYYIEYNTPGGMVKGPVAPTAPLAICWAALLATNYMQEAAEEIYGTESETVA